MILKPGEVRWAVFTTTVEDALEVWLDGQWRALTAGSVNVAGTFSAGSGTSHAIRIAHSAVGSPPVGAVVLTPGIYTTQVRLAGSEEVLISDSDPINSLAGTIAWPVNWGDLPRPANPETAVLSEQFAVAILRALTLYRIGGDPVTLMPCSHQCRNHETAFFPNIYDGVFTNACRCGYPCSCGNVQRLTLPAPVGRVDAVVVDGVTLDPADYHVENSEYLVRDDGGTFPACSSSDFTVTYVRGFPVDMLGSRAAGVLAYEYSRALAGDRACRLPMGTTQVVRNGITVQVAQTLFPSGVTGLSEVDAYVRLWNPYGLTSAPAIYSPDFEEPRQITWSAP